jgi:hypothetical protein
MANVPVSVLLASITPRIPARRRIAGSFGKWRDKMPEYKLRLNDGRVVSIDTESLVVTEIKQEEVINSIDKIDIIKECFGQLRKAGRAI